MEFVKSTVTVKVYGQEFAMRLPTFKEIGIYRESAKDLKSDVGLADHVTDFLATMGLPKDIGDSMEAEHLLELASFVIEKNEEVSDDDFKICKLSYFYKIHPNEFLKMTGPQIEVMWQSITMIEAQEQLKLNKAQDWPNGSDKERSKEHRRLYEMAYPKVFEEETFVTPEHLASILQGRSNG